jgi:succinoglycan biosynthesis transport protein ExoP
MLHLPESKLNLQQVHALHPDMPIGPSGKGGSGFKLSEIVDFLRRQWMVIVAGFVLCLLFGTVYLFVAAPRYTAKTLLMLDNRKAQPMGQSLLSEASIDSGFVESQLEVIKSDNVALAVVKDLKLGSDAEFTTNVGSFFTSLAAAVSKALDFGSIDSHPVDSQDEMNQRAVKHLKKELVVSRVGRTYVLEIRFRSLDSGRAAQIANAIADAYILDQLESKYKATKRASGWLKQRIEELRVEAIAADQAVQDYKAQHSIIDMGRGLLSEQQLGEINTQLLSARAQTAEARARLDRINEVMNSNLDDASVADSLRNDVIVKLRQQYAEASRREADFSSRYGREHQAAANLRKEMQQIERVVRDELRRMSEVYKSDMEIALNREGQLQANLQDAIRRSGEARQAQVSLRLLESSAQSYRNLYDNFLQRFAESTQQQSFPNTESRIITPAATAEKTDPVPLLVLSIAGMTGLMVGFGAAVAREQLDRAFRTSSQVEHFTGVECLGVLPALPQKAGPPTRPRPDRGDRVVVEDLGIARQVVNAPFSRFTETLRSIKVAVDTNGPSRNTQVIGIVSALPGEGKSTISANVAELAAHTGGRTLLIDGDLRKPNLTKRMTPTAQNGLLQVLSGEMALEDVLWQDEVTGLHILPAVLRTPIAHTADLLSSEAMGHLLSRARQEYEYIIVDLPPLAPVVDAKAAAHLIDAFLLVVHWGQTARAAVHEVLTSAEVVRSKLLGTVLNQADEAALSRIEAYKGSSYYRYYSSGYLSSTS